MTPRAIEFSETLGAANPSGSAFFQPDASQERGCRSRAQAFGRAVPTRRCRQ
jgi:hypothetical protein